MMTVQEHDVAYLRACGALKTDLPEINRSLWILSRLEVLRELKENGRMPRELYIQDLNDIARTAGFDYKAT